MHGLRHIRRYASAEELARVGAAADLHRLVDCALAVPAVDELASRADREQALEIAAVEVAPVDFARARRLIEEAARAASRSDPADPRQHDLVLRAAASGADPAAARRYVAQLTGGQAAAYLDLAARTETADSAVELLRLAEQTLVTEEADTLPLILARLAAGWTRLDPARATPFVDWLESAWMTASAELLAEQSSGGRHAVPVRPDLDTWVKVAERLAEADPAKARELLSAVCAIPLQRLEGIPELALAAAADLWARWGDTDRCRQAAEIVLRQDWSHRGILPSPDLRVARTLYHVDPAAAETIVQHGFAQLELEHDLHEADPIGRSLIDLRLSELADVLAGWDVPRALEVARQVSQVGWTRGSDPDHANDRASLLARIAHRLVASDPDQAHGVLEECFGLTLTQIVLGHPQPAAHPGLLYRPVGDGETRPEGSKMGGLANDLAAFGNLREHWRTATGWTLYHEPADIARSVLPPPSAGGSSASWGRTLRTFADRLAADHPQRASRLIDWLADPAEEAIGAARLAVLAHQANRADAPYWWVRTTAALEALPQYACDLNLTATDPGLAFAYLNPRARANGEAAIRLAHWDVPTALSLLAQTGSSYLMLAFRASLLCQAAEVSNRDETQASHLDAAQLLDLHTSVLKEAEGWADPLLTAVTTMRLVVNLATLRPTEAAGLAARVRLPVYRALATVLLAPSTPDPAGTCRDAVAGLPDDTLPHHKTAIAALGTTSLRQVDPAGAAELAETALLIARTANTPLLRARALLELAVRYDGHDLHDPIGLLGDVTDELQQVLEHDRRAELLRLLFVAALVIEPARAPGILAQALELGWSDTMALIEEAAGPLLARCGTDLPERLHDAIGTARACLQDPHRRPAAPPWHIDGVRLEGRSREAVS